MWGIFGLYLYNFRFLLRHGIFQSVVDAVVDELVKRSGKDWSEAIQNVLRDTPIIRLSDEKACEIFVGRFHLFGHEACELSVVLEFVCRAHAGIPIKLAFCQLAQFREQHFIHIVKDELHIGLAGHFVGCFKIGIEPVTVAVRQDGNGGFRPVEVKL